MKPSLAWYGPREFSRKISPPRTRGRSKHSVCDPKGSDLCLASLKPEEIPVEERRGSDVQIDPVS